MCSLCVYGPHICHQKASLWDRLAGVIDKMGGAWFIFGYFNVIRKVDDRLNSQVKIKEMDDFNDSINLSWLVEVPMGGRKFTRVSDDGVKFIKLDRFLMNKNFKSLWSNLAVLALDRKLFDHCPMVLKDIDVDFGLKPFRVFDVWLEEVDIEHVVSGTWKKVVRGSWPDCRSRIRPRFYCDRVVKISDEDAGMLEGKIGEKEVWNVICGCSGDKSPGPDGFNFKFIKKMGDYKALFDDSSQMVMGYDGDF
ncbi:RNA-directed DNA polymerase, eukaryota [Tanacetum coccineum]